MKINSEVFFENWLSASKIKEQEILAAWSNSADLSSVIMYEEDSVVDILCRNLNLSHYSEYYSLDKVIYDKSSDLVPNSPTGQTWLRQIKVAFEHENFFNSGLFQELSHLLITTSELKVIVSYPNKAKEINRELKKLHEIISGVDIKKELSAQRSLILIFAWAKENTVEWIGLAYNEEDWIILNSEPNNLLQKINIKPEYFSKHEYQEAVDSILN